MSEKLFEIRMIEDTPDFTECEEVTPSSVNILEKDIEDWFVNNTKLIFSDKKSVFVLAQELKGESLADILALDSQGNLLVIEIKRDWSDRATVGQLLDYASNLSKWSYEEFNTRYRKYTGESKELIDEFRSFVENPEFEKSDLFAKQRLFVVAPYYDEPLIRIIRWLKEYDLPIDYVPFRIYRKDGGLLLKIEQITIEPIEQRWGWNGDWFFNTNETYGSGAYQKMIKQQRIGIYGYTDPEGILSKPNVGDRVFLYRNGVGIIAVAELGEEIKRGNEIFGQVENNECHRTIRNLKVLKDNGVSSAQVKKMGYNLPVRSTLCKIYNPTVAKMLYEEIERNS